MLEPIDVTAETEIRPGEYPYLGRGGHEIPGNEETAQTGREGQDGQEELQGSLPEQAAWKQSVEGHPLEPGSTAQGLSGAPASKPISESM